MKIIHASDLHLDSPLRGLVHYEGAPTDDVRMATRHAFSALVDLCLSEEARYLLIAGDLYDGDFKDYATALYFVEQVARLRETGTQVVWLRGNHDAANRMTRHLQAAEHVHELSVEHPQTLTFERDGVAFHGQGYAMRDVHDDLSQGYPAPVSGLVNVGLLHTSLDGRPGHAPYAPCTLNGLKSRGYDYWALGHVHQREVLAEEPWVVFSGNLQGRHIKETGEKGCMVLSVENGRVQTVVPVGLDQVRWELCEVDLSSAQSMDDVLQECAQRLTTIRASSGGRLLATRVRLVGHTDAHHLLSQSRSRVENELRAQSVDFGDVYLEGVQYSTVGQMTAQALAARRDALGDLFRAFDEVKSDAGAKSALWDDLLRPLSAISADLLRNEGLDRDEILTEAARLLEGYLLQGESKSEV